jgi:hypothetical protein
MTAQCHNKLGQQKQKSQKDFLQLRSRNTPLFAVVHRPSHASCHSVVSMEDVVFHWSFVIVSPLREEYWIIHFEVEISHYPTSSFPFPNIPFSSGCT